MRRQIINWLEHRTGIETGVRNFLYEEIPASSGWHQVLGSIAVFLFLLQAFTGALLAFNYAPTPGDAYNSVRYIVQEVTAGELIHNLHHWGASLMIVVVVLHMTQVFLWGAYKKPREATWLVGVVLLLITLAYGLTGYLLPWDNRAYWGTVVTTQIAATAPVLGPYMARLMGGEGGAVGVVTFARFYALHVLLLPPATLLLIGIHIYLVRKHGVAPAAADQAPKVRFYPRQVLRDTVAVFVCFAVLFLAAIFARAPLGRLADPTDSSYVPRPEWYFLFLFQLLKVFEGPLEVFGTVVLPGLAVLALAAAPFLDRGQVRRVSQRTTAIGVVVLGAIAWTGLTAAAIRSTPGATAAIFGQGPEDWQQLSPEELAGIGFYRRENCSKCHTLGEAETKVGPDLANAPRKNAAWMIAHFKRPQEMVPGSMMPPIQLSDSQLNALAAFLLKLTPMNAEALQGAPAIEVEGAIVYQRFQCGACHLVNGVGMKLGPPLNGLSARRKRDWVVEHFRDPQKLSPGSTMPPYRFTPRDLERITAYVLSIPQ